MIELNDTACYLCRGAIEGLRLRVTLRRVSGGVILQQVEIDARRIQNFYASVFRTHDMIDKDLFPSEISLHSARHLLDAG